MEERKHRTRLQIVADILSAVNGGAKKTHIMYGARLNQKLLNQYLGIVMNAGLVHENNSNFYEITDKGRRFLERSNSFWRKKKHLYEFMKIVDDLEEKLEELVS